VYLEHFGLAEAPFTISPDPRYLFLTPQHKEALAKCQYIISQKGGLAVIYGDIGTGKTPSTNSCMRCFMPAALVLSAS
jgi:general secretion pathway protein A